MTHIDGFAGPREWPDTWAVKLVLEMEPRWLRNFYPFDSEPEQVRHLEALKRARQGDVMRAICTWCLKEEKPDSLGRAWSPRGEH